jgi:hypothetical protein
MTALMVCIRPSIRPASLAAANPAGPDRARPLSHRGGLLRQ